MIYESQSSSPSTERSNIEPWTSLARYKYEAECAVLSLMSEEFEVVILRPAFVYGIGDYHTIMSRIVCAACYTSHGLNETMSLLWDGNMKLNTVHVHDVCRAMWYAIEHVPNGSIWNLCDKSDFDVGQVSVGVINNIVQH